MFGAGALPAQRAAQRSLYASARIVCERTAGELKNIIERRECLAGQCARRPGAEPKMTSNALWRLLRKYENGKTAEKSPVFVPPVGEERKRKNKREGRREMIKGSFLSSVSK